MRVSLAVLLSCALTACGSSNGTKPGGGSDQPQCSDGIDNDGDGLIDYPNDPGCFSPNQDSEVDDCPSGPNCPECANGIDDDMNGLIDYPNDPGCSAAGDPDEYTFDVYACGGGTMVEELPFNNEVMGMFNATSGVLMGKCGGSGDQHIYLLHMKKAQVVVATSDTGSTSTDTVLYIRSANCPDQGGELACNDNVSASDLASTVTASLDVGTYYLVVQAHDSSVSGPFDVKVSFYAGEGTACTTAMDCGPGLVCRVPQGGSSMVCSKPMCSDGVDDDGDGKADFPDDPGCDTPDDNDETDDCPNGPNCPECGNGIDDNMNGKTDFPMEPNCLAASTSSEWCAVHENVTKITTASIMGDTSNAVSDFDESANQCAFGTGVPDLTYRIDVPALDTLTVNVDTGGAWFPIVELLDHTCAGTALTCAGDSITQTTLAAGTYFLVVDGDSSTDHGSFTLSLSGDIKAGESCEGALAQSGALHCAAGTICKGTVGSRTCAKAQCNDGIDNNSAGGTDYPNDPGCDSPDDDSEVEPATLPQCADGTDNDTDTKVDYAADLSCWAKSGTMEAFCNSETDRVQLLYATTQTGSNTTAHDNYMPSCGFSSGGADVTFALVLPVPVDTMEIDTFGTSYDTVLAVTTSTCMPANELACDDDSVGLQSQVTLTSLAAGTYAVVVDEYDSSTPGAFTLNAHGVVAAGTACTSDLFTSGVLSCPAGTTCSGGTCQ